MADFAEQRRNMVDCQVRPSDITDRRIIRAMLDVPRERFVPPALEGTAYRDETISLAKLVGSPRPMLAPRVIAKLIQLASIEPDARVLVIGSGTGYSAALVATMAAEVVLLEATPEIAALAQGALAKAGAKPVEIVSGSLADGSAQKAPFDAILVEGCVETIAPALLDQLKDGGRLVAIEREGGVGRAVAWLRTGGTFGKVIGFDASAPVLPGFAKPVAFRL